ncbi:unnamed protein product [Dibothriocephalus latus]|uniref:DNA methyltransferase 1-associated 1 domain-containing protein n=1 Tax=Dibothriocephalus latus TaxID=60516 RepID=A0A3P7QL59_DIBLA|nr:unnamed protein product [Dibothriocephalus latus]
MRYDVDHERRRKQQLSLLYGRTRDEVEEEERLIGELNRIEARRRDRERKKQDLQKLISQAESVARDGTDRLESFTPTDERIGLSGAAIGAASFVSSGRGSHQMGSVSAGLSAVATAVSSSLAASTSIAFPDFSKNPGVHLRSQKVLLCSL